MALHRGSTNTEDRREEDILAATGARLRLEQALGQVHVAKMSGDQRRHQRPVGQSLVDLVTVEESHDASR